VPASTLAPEQKEEKICALWKTAQQRVLLEESWLAANERVNLSTRNALDTFGRK
jgi:hypothetical protein